jgi:two-component system cell cycle sensor histidine kinase/response regulator CckA
VRTPTDRELSRLFDRTPIGMFRSSESGRFLYANQALARMLGYGSVEQLLAVNLNTDVYRDPDARRRLLDEYRARGVLDGVRMEWKTRDGRPLIVQIYGHVVGADDGREPAGGEVSFDASVVDITEAEAARQRAFEQRDELERTARTLELVVRQMPALYWLVDRDLRILRTGGAVEEVLGFPPDRWVGHTLDEPIADDGASASASEAIPAHRRALAGETVTYSSDFRGKRLATTVTPYRRDGEIVGAIGTAIDVTASHALERRMVDAQRAESLGVLAGGLAHDFNNLLVAILGNTELGLRDTPPGAPGRASLENIRSAGLRAAELTAQLLAYAGRSGFGVTRVDPAGVVGELLQISAPTMPPNVDVHVDLPAGLAIRGDEAQVRQVMLNLIANARDALGGASGSISITGSGCHHDGALDPDDVITAAPGYYVQLEIADDGPGIDREVRRRIFEPFFTTKPTGHGLGLAAVLGIVRAHRGGLRVASAPDQGARFTVLWPATTTPTAQRAVAPASHTVLVVDDEDLVRDVVARMIEDLGYAALTAADGQAGIDMLDHQAVDAVLVDLTMPRMNGVDVIAAMRAKKPELRIVLCTGFDRERRGPVQADAYLPKPFRIEALEATLAKLLS